LAAKSVEIDVTRHSATIASSDRGLASIAATLSSPSNGRATKGLETYQGFLSKNAPSRPILAAMRPSNPDE